MQAAAVQLNDVCRAFGLGHTRIEALTHLSLSLSHGSKVAVTGPSGSGKTTLLNLIGALDRPTSGTVHVLGDEVSRFSERQASAFRRQHVGLVFQDDALVPELTVFENVELPLVLLKRPAKARQARVMLLLEQLGLIERLRSFPPLLSGGEKQRVAVARAAAHAPQLLLADEPSANLDPRSTEAVMQAIDDLAKENPLTVIVATHDSRIFTRFDAQIRLKDGALERIALREA